MIPKLIHIKHNLTKGLNINNNQGFTLIETAIAICILSVGLLALASMQVACMNGNAFASDVTEATTLAADHLEKLIALPYTHSDLAAGNHTAPNPPGGYSIAWSVTDNSPLNDTKTINLTIAWQAHGPQKNISMRRIVPRIL